ncbi:hypothetical protein [Roseomonas chloroacetimidivorans]|jgi:hypothetical protein|uniref:hypothetical protein n=1 Tax=Roseomonas chloroacetimidivorans TaxID=1766656 RepID=UPI003C729307
MFLPRLLVGALLLVGSVSVASAETCSTSTLTSSTFSFARWCGDPPGPGTLRMGLRNGRGEEFSNVPLDIYREVIRTPNVPKYVAEEIQPHFQQTTVAPSPQRAAPAASTARTPPPAKPHAAAEPRRVPRAVAPKLAAAQPARVARPAMPVRQAAVTADPHRVLRLPEPVGRGRTLVSGTRAPVASICAAPVAARGVAHAAKATVRNPACRS